MQRILLLILSMILLCGCGQIKNANIPHTPALTQPTPTETTAPPVPVHRIAKETIIDGNVTCTGVYNYNELGQLMGIVRTYDESGKPYNHEVFAYDEGGNMTLHETWFTDELLDTRYDYEYDAQNRITVGYDKVVDDNIWCRYEYCYDAAGKLEKRIVRNRMLTDDSVIGQQLYTYTAEGLLSRMEYYDVEQTLLQTEDYTYNEKGQLTQKVTATFNTEFDTVHTENYYYDGQGYLVTYTKESQSEDLSYAKVKYSYIYEDVIID